MNTVLLVFAVLMVFFGIAALFEKLLGRQDKKRVPFEPSYQEKYVNPKESQEKDISNEKQCAYLRGLGEGYFMGSMMSSTHIKY